MPFLPGGEEGKFRLTARRRSCSGRCFSPGTWPRRRRQGHHGHRKAIAKVRTAMAKEGISPEQGGLRLGVQGGGCSGLSYNIRFDTQPRERDRIFQFDDVRVFVNPKSFIYLHGMILDYQETLIQKMCAQSSRMTVSARLRVRVDRDLVRIGPRGAEDRG